MGLGVGSLYQKMQQVAAERAAALRASQKQRIVDDYVQRMGAAQPNYESLNKSLQSHLGSQEDYSGTLQRRGKLGERARLGLFEQAAEQAPPNAQIWLNRRLSGSDPGDIAVQLGVGGLAASGTALGLTAAGQGLFALTSYLQESIATAEKADQPLTS